MLKGYVMHMCIPTCMFRIRLFLSYMYLHVYMYIHVYLLVYAVDEPPSFSSLNYPLPFSLALLCIFNSVASIVFHVTYPEATLHSIVPFGSPFMHTFMSGYL